MQQDIYMPLSAVSERKALQSHQQEHSVPHPPVTPSLQLCLPMSRERMFTVQSSSTRPGDTDDTPRCNFGLLYSQSQPRLISTIFSRTEETCSVEVLSKVMQFPYGYLCPELAVKICQHRTNSGVTSYRNSTGSSKITVALLR